MKTFDDSADTLAKYSRTTLPEGTRARAVVQPQSAQEIQEIVKQARAQKLRLHPIACGRNWGYGDALAPTDGQVIVDLSRMNKILEVNTELAYAVIEPGVTQGMLHQYLVDHKIDLWMDANGAGPDVSIVGNILERGFGHTPIGDRASQTCSMQVVLGNGEVLDTGFAHYVGAKSVYTYKHGIGPSLDGLFFQSNYGIVTRLGIWLMPKPESFRGFHCAVSNDEDLPELVARLSHLKRHGIVRSCMHVLNPLRALVKRIDYPWDETGGKIPVSQKRIDEWCTEFGVGAWNVTGGVYGPSTMTSAAINVVRDVMQPFVVTEFDSKTVANMCAEGKTDNHLYGPLEAASSFLQGTPTRGALRTTSWRSKAPVKSESDPLENGPGLIWIVPAIPATAKDVSAAYRLLKTEFARHKFDLPITFTVINERTITCTTNISFNQQDSNDVVNAKGAYRDIVQKLIRAGYPPYRSGVHGYDLLQNGSMFWRTAANLKSVLDPDGVISPGHYITGTTR